MYVKNAVININQEPNIYLENMPRSAYIADRGLISRHTYYSTDFPYWQKN